jgi:hypothetical protein
LGQASAGGEAVASDSWIAAGFGTGTNANGYDLDTIQLAMTGATGGPSGFTAMLYSAAGTFGIFPGSNIGTLNGSANPSNAGTYSYTPIIVTHQFQVSHYRPILFILLYSMPGHQLPMVLISGALRTLIPTTQAADGGS